MSDETRSPGRFVTLEGGEGAGKSSQIPHVAETLRARGHEVVVTREPGGTALGEAVRGVLMNEYDVPMPAMSELLLMFAARAAHLEQVIEPALARGTWVVCDRFTDASYAYQGAARQLGDDAVATLEQLVQNDRRPDHVLLFDLPVTDGLARAGRRGEGNRFDRETVAFHERVRAAYRTRAAADPARYHVIDAAQPPATVRARIEAAIAAWPA
ncbi:thymidylate kinase [Salinisphaera orenii MK-B5]|uniref:Thymidylate kinase n=1 Tax=Salinisphaera orenii MK-B5 TaxID=856730 RepID=A0A423PKT7_9GAMM|nr:dTMP kinase [Salinisphaera orenii]ROO26215.1 thymidylate kinase [Salinisphaera orenii MK-B5]